MKHLSYEAGKALCGSVLGRHCHVGEATDCPGCLQAVSDLGAAREVAETAEARCARGVVAAAKQVVKEARNGGPWRHAAETVTFARLVSALTRLEAARRRRTR